MQAGFIGNSITIFQRRKIKPQALRRSSVQIQHRQSGELIWFAAQAAGCLAVGRLDAPVPTGQQDGVDAVFKQFTITLLGFLLGHIQVCIAHRHGRQPGDGLSQIQMLRGKEIRLSVHQGQHPG